MLSSKANPASYFLFALLSFSLFCQLAIAQSTADLPADESTAQKTYDNLTLSHRFEFGINLGLTSEINDIPGILSIVTLLYNASDRLSFSVSTGFFSRQNEGTTTTYYSRGDNNQLTEVERIQGNNKTQNAIPLFLRGRYYIKKGAIKPYVSMEWNYFYLTARDNSPSFESYIIESNGEKRLFERGNSVDRLGYGFGLGLGLNTSLGTNRKLDFSLQLIHSNYTAEYFRFMAGYYFGL